jgi:hypothetical protein
MPVEDLGHKKLLPIMDKKMKNHYQVPTIKVVAFKVEDVFTSPLTVTQDTGIETFDNSNSWAVRPFTPVQLNQE